MPLVRTAHNMRAAQGALLTNLPPGRIIIYVEVAGAMDVRIVRMPGFAVIGREGSTDEGEGFISRLWAEANARYGEIAKLVIMENGAPRGLWGAMSDMGRHMLPWEDGFTRGLYLAGAEALKDAQAPAGWARWDIPEHTWLMIPVVEGVPRAMQQGLEYMEAHGLRLAGAVCDYTRPGEGEYCAFPVERA